MALLPYMFDKDWIFPRPGSLLNKLTTDVVGQDYKPWKELAQFTQDLSSSVQSDRDKFQVNVDVQHFAPEEISVKTANGYVVIEGKHEEKQDQHGYVSRQFVRRYALPEGCHEENVQSKLSTDGVLTVTAPKQQLSIRGERAVPIQQTGPVRKHISSGGK